MPDLDPLPYFPAFAKQLRGPTNAMVLTYLEMCHPAPQDPNGAILDRPVTIDCDAACERLQISRRTLHVALRCLGAWFLTEDARGRAERVARAFINADHSRYGMVKFYSVVGSRHFFDPGRQLSIKRNFPHFNALFQRSGLAPQLSDVYSAVSCDSPNPPFNEIGASSCSARSLPELLRKAMPAWGDRRAERWERWRRETGKKSSNPGRMRGVDDRRKIIGSLDKPYIYDSDAASE